MGELGDPDLAAEVEQAAGLAGDARVDASADATQVVTDLDATDGTRVRTERWTDRDGTSNGELTGRESFGTTSREIDASAEATAFVVDPDNEADASTR